MRDATDAGGPPVVHTWSAGCRRRRRRCADLARQLAVVPRRRRTPRRHRRRGVVGPARGTLAARASTRCALSCRSPVDPACSTRSSGWSTASWRAAAAVRRSGSATACAVDGHGDLIADDIFCLDDGPRVLDCLEFDDRLRYLDRLDDAASWPWTSSTWARPSWARASSTWYAEFSGDDAPPSLVAPLRRLPGVRPGQGRLPARGAGLRTSAAEARRLSAVALAHLRTGAVRLVLVGGPPGSGKSTLADGPGRPAGRRWLSDRVRKELAGLDPRAPRRRHR